MISDNHNYKSSSNLMQADSRGKLLKELNSVLMEYSDVEFLASKDLSTIKLSLYDITMIVQSAVNSTSQNYWKIISSDLPELSCDSSNEKTLFTLREIRNLFQKQIYSLEDVWSELRKIDIYCTVTDPINPKPHHLYRRIYLSPSVPFLLTLNPTDPTGHSRMKFLGITNEVEKYRDMLQNEDVIDKWDLECSVFENLLALLNIDDFPQPPKYDNSLEGDGTVGDDECCICFSKQLENGELPDEWLQELGTNKIILHNFLITDDLSSGESRYLQNHDGAVFDNIAIPINQDDEIGNMKNAVHMRDILANYFMSEVGAVPWQEEFVVVI